MKVHRHAPVVASKSGLASNRSPSLQRLARLALGAPDPLSAWRGAAGWGAAWADAERLMNSLSRLDRAEQQRGLELLSGKPLENKALEYNLRLALHDEPTWAQVLSGLARPSHEQAKMLMPALTFERGLGVLAQRLPAQSKKTLLSMVGTLYPRLATSSDGQTSPKREADFFIHAAFDGGRIIRDALNAGHSVTAAYDAYLVAQKRAVFDQVAVGDYRARDVLRAVQALRGAVAKLPASVPARKRFALMGGSVPAGRAMHHRSDVDFSSPNYLSEGIAEATRQLRAGWPEGYSRLHFSFFGSGDLTPAQHGLPGEYASSSPVIFSASERRAELWLYETQFRLHHDTLRARRPLAVLIDG